MTAQPPSFKKVRNPQKITSKDHVRKNRSPWAPLAEKCTTDPGTWFSVPPALATEKRFITTAPLALARYLKNKELEGTWEFGETTEGGVRKHCVRYLTK